MKRIYLIALLSAIFFVGCKEETPEVIPHIFSLSSATAITFPAIAAEDNDVTIGVITNQMSWEVVSSQSWCKITKNVSDNNFTVSAASNPSLIAPSPAATITITVPGAAPKIIVVTQTPHQAGTLGTIVKAAGNPATTKSIVVSYAIDERDFVFMRDSMPALEDIDLTEATIVAHAPDGLANAIPVAAFMKNWAGKLSLKSIKLPTSITLFGHEAFYGCSGLTTMPAIPAGVKTIEMSAFDGCTEMIGTLTLPSGLTTIGEAAFFDCKKLTGALTIPNSVTTLGATAFYGCSGFTGTLTLSNSLSYIDGSVFEGCSKLTGTLVIPSNVTSIEAGAFIDCSSLTALTLGSGVIAIRDRAFDGCAGLAGTLTIPNNVTIIGESAFKACDALTNIKVAWSTPITYTTDMFPAKPILVPFASEALYTAAAGWDTHTITGY